MRSMSDDRIEQLLTNGRVNTVLAWALCSLFAFTALEGVLTGDLLWSAFALFVGLSATLPAIARRNPRRMPPWEVVMLAGLPVLGRAVATLRVPSAVATYLSIAALALLVAANLDLFTAVEMNVPFAVLFVVVTTLATAGIWAVVRWVVDLSFGTTLLLDPALTHDEIETGLMWEFVGAAVAGLVAGLVFEWYVRRRAAVDTRLERGETG